MRCRRGSMCRYVHSKDLEQEAQCSGATDRQSDGAVTRVPQPPLRLIPSFRQPRTFYARSNHPETQQEQQAQVVRHAHSKSERVVVQIALKNPKTTLVVFKSLTAHADTLELYK